MPKVSIIAKMNIDLKRKPLMVLGTSSGAGKTLINTAICRYLRRKGEQPIPFKGQNMSNNAWVDNQGREMAYSQALQAWSAGIEPSAEMNPVLLKPKGEANERERSCHPEACHDAAVKDLIFMNPIFYMWETMRNEKTLLAHYVAL